MLDVFLDTVDQRAIPHDYPLELIEGVAHGSGSRALRRVFRSSAGACQRIGGMVSLMMAHVVGFRDPALDYMADLGLAIELTTLLRDTGAHLARGRVYLPAEEMEACGYSEADLRAARCATTPFEQLMRLAGCAHPRVISSSRTRAGAARSARPIRGEGRVRSVPADAAAHRNARDFDVFRQRRGVPAVERAWITARSMAGPITRRLWKAWVLDAFDLDPLDLSLWVALGVTLCGVPPSFVRRVPELSGDPEAPPATRRPQLPIAWW